MPNRRSLLQKLESYRPLDAADRAQAERITNFVREHDDCFSRALETGHITGSAWIVDRTGTKVLLTHHKKLNKWLQLGGHADGDPDVARVALREAREESGLEQLTLLSSDIFDVDVHPIPARKDEPAHFHYDIRFLIRAEDDALVMSDESLDLAWIELDRLHEFSREESLLRMARKWHHKIHESRDLQR